jgi:peptidyl-prolyl cis-trans isomerase SurA
MRPRRSVRAALVLLAGLAAGASRAEVANRIVATIDGEPVTTYEVEKYAGERGLATAPREQALQALITDRLLEKEIKTLGIAARDEEIDRYIGEIQQRNGLDPRRFEEALTAQGLTVAAYRARVKTEIEKAQLVNREIRQRVNVSPEEVRRYYDAHHDDYALRDRVKVRHILVTTDRDEPADVARARAAAEEVRALAAKGRSFADLAREHSRGPGADKGGELGTFSRGEMEKALDEAAFALKPGQVSGVVETAAGFHILRVDERIAAGHRPLDEVKDEIRETLYNQALEERFQNWLSRDLRERHHVEVVD